MGPELIVLAILHWSWLPAVILAVVLFWLWAKRSARPYITGIASLAILFSFGAGVFTFTSGKMFTEPQYWISTLLLFFSVGTLMASVAAVLVWAILQIAKQLQSTSKDESNRAV